jgi:hypothetical protein
MSNRPVIEYVRQYFDPQQWRSTIHAYSDSAGVEKLNLVVISGQGDEQKAELTLACHTDTVPFAPEWSDAVRPAMCDGNLYGRGSLRRKRLFGMRVGGCARTGYGPVRSPVGDCAYRRRGNRVRRCETSGRITGV